jgi:hypothetical protein
MKKLPKPPHPLLTQSEDKKTTTISLSQSTHAKVKAVANHQRRTFSAQAELLIESGLKQEARP